jgi:hypothetical protein
VKRNERNALTSEIVHERFALAAVRTQSYVHRVAMIEAEMIVNCSLSERADGQRVFESRREEAFYL